MRTLEVWSQALTFSAFMILRVAFAFHLVGFGVSY
jgi:hypothetical protein